MGTYKITPELQAAMQADRDKGASIADICAKYHVGKNFVTGYTHSKSPKPERTAEFWAQVQADRDAGMRVHDLEAKYRIGGRILAEHIDLHTNVVHIDWSVLEPQMQADRDSGMSVRELSHKYGVAEYTVREHTEDTFPMRWDYWTGRILSAGRRQGRSGH